MATDDCQTDDPGSNPELKLRNLIKCSTQKSCQAVGPEIKGISRDEAIVLISPCDLTRFLVLSLVVIV